MKQFRQLREEINTKRLTQLVRAGLVDSSKLTLLKRMLSKDVTKLTPREKQGMSELLDSVLDQVLDNTQIFNKVKNNLQTEGVITKSVPYEISGDLPAVLILKRKAIRVFPNGQRIALYYNQKLDTFVSIPYSGIGVAAASNQISVHEDLNILKTAAKIIKPDLNLKRIPRPARKLNENVHGALKAIVANKQTMPVRFPDGTMRVDHTTANKILNIHGAVNDENKEKMVKMMNKSKNHFLKLAKFAHNH